ncbi:MAG: hypothetical protein ACFB8W_20405 [Elainellaceae cyanobacterium]
MNISQILRAALTGTLSALIVGASPLAVKAEPFWLMGNQLPPGLEQMDLTAQQRQQIDSIRSDAVSELTGVINPGQIRTFGMSMAQGQSFQQAVESMEITAEQRRQIRSVFSEMNSDISDALTPQQRQRLAEYRQTHDTEQNPFGE